MGFRLGRVPFRKELLMRKQDAENFRAWSGFGPLGAIGILFVSYVILFQCGLVKTALFPGVLKLPLNNLGTLVYLGIMLVISVTLFLWSFCKIHINSQGIVVSGLLGQRFYPWSDVTRVERSFGRAVLHLRTGRRVIHPIYSQYEKLIASLIRSTST
jgi:hypothetical protein